MIFIFLFWCPENTKTPPEIKIINPVLLNEMQKPYIFFLKNQGQWKQFSDSIWTLEITTKKRSQGNTHPVTSDPTRAG
jgi:hypothetical protein